jgi:hypothetical protein
MTPQPGTELTAIRPRVPFQLRLAVCGSFVLRDPKDDLS